MTSVSPYEAERHSGEGRNPVKYVVRSTRHKKECFARVT